MKAEVLRPGLPELLGFVFQCAACYGCRVHTCYPSSVVALQLSPVLWILRLLGGAECLLALVTVNFCKLLQTSPTIAGCIGEAEYSHAMAIPTEKAQGSASHKARVLRPGQALQKQPAGRCREPSSSHSSLRMDQGFWHHVENPGGYRNK